MAQAGRPKAYSYIRFSTPQQAQGDSLRRQTEKASLYAEQHGLELDDELKLQDLGVSAYRGKNASATGALGGFVAAVERGQVEPGSYLLIENMDRLTRAVMTQAVGFFFRIMAADITVVTLTNGMAFSQESVNNNQGEVFLIIAELMRANQESARKAQLVGDAKARRKVRLQAGELIDRPYTRQTPAWLRWDDNLKAYRLIEERAAIVREIFEKAAAGRGLDGIAKEFNARGEPTWSERKRKAAHWRGSYIRKIVSSTAPLGTFTPHTTTRDPKTQRRRDVALPGIVGLFPAVVDGETYGKAARRIGTTGARGRHAAAELKTPFAGVLKCGVCGQSIIRVSKGGYVYLVCSAANARAQGCAYRAIRHDEFEGWFIERLPDIVRAAPRGKSAAALDKQIAALRASVGAQEAETFDLARFAAEERTRATREALREAEARLAETQRDLSAVVLRRDESASASVKERLRELLQAWTTAPLDVRSTNDALKQAVQRIDVDLPGAAIAVCWHHGDEPQEVRYPNRHMDWSVRQSWQSEHEKS